MKLSVIFLTVLVPSHARLYASQQHRRQVLVALASTTFPLYSQQCDRDEGPRVENDADTFGSGVKYHNDSPAFPVLLSGGKCADPLKAACSIRNDPKLAYMEGPIDCGDNGFFCTVTEQDDWEPRELLDNLNFGYCNRTEAFDGTEFQDDGHCHGSDDDSAYYWVLRDHWFRQYNGRLRCCCNWDSEEVDDDDPLSNGLFTNRCDYRRWVPERQEGDCRNANKAVKNFEDGCDPDVEAQQTGNPVPENDAVCWEILNFGQPKPFFAEGDVCKDDGDFIFKKIPGRDCDWVGKRPSVRCEREYEGKDLMEYCPRTCGLCPGDDEGKQEDDDGALDGCIDDLEFRFRNKEDRDCEWVGRRPNVRCQRIWDGQSLEIFCPESCGVCE
ncbi:unnamed protein product [Cylindrotheca closterium]|uniref:ShKT domain-containing protein n=1 Tax=Cylindrotheca closterium TaxID=2856 RepID=A0AAD2G475_9STRA|nr:unnamed protein product [Cylindrotheca closterium]